MPPAPPGMPPAPPGMDAGPPAPPGMPPAPPGMDAAPPAPPGMPPAPPGMDAAPPAPPEMPPAPPGMDSAPPAPPEMPPAPPGMDLAPPAPPEMPPAPPGMDLAPPAPPEMPPAPPGMDLAPPAPPEMPPAPPGMDLAPPAPPEMPPAPPGMDAGPPAPPEMPPAPPGMDAGPPAPPEMPPAPPGMDAGPPAPPEMPPAPPGMDLAPPAPPEVPPAPPGMDLAPPAPPEMPPAPPGMDLAPPAPPEVESMTPNLDLLSPPSSEESGDEEMPSETSDSEMVIDPLAPITPVNEEDDFISAGAKIRQSRDVDEVAGDKLEGTLHEMETTILHADGSIIKQDVKGSITVKNPSESDRIFDIDVLLNNTENTDIGGDHIAVAELDSSKEFTTKYKVKGTQMLVLRERIDTNPDRDQERSHSISLGGEGNRISLEIEVENTSRVSLKDVMVTREFPDVLSVISAGNFDLESNVLSWDVGHLASGMKEVLSLECLILVDDISPVNAGVAKATYKADATLSNLEFRELDAFCRGFAYMNVVEDERPDNWQCKTIFENRSSFAVDLTKLQVKMKGSDELLFDISDVPEDVLPDSRWESETKIVEANEKPDFTYDLGYTVLPRVTESTEGSIALESSVLEVLDAELKKKYSKTVLPSYRQQNLNAEITITNTGSSTINLMRLTDDIPGLFMAPSLENVVVKSSGNDLPDDQVKIEVSEGVSIEKERRSPDGPGFTMTMTIGTRGPIGLGPGKSLTVTYPLTAPDPSPGNELVAGPSRCEFSAERFGPICMADLEEIPLVKVRHNRRNFSAGKSVMPIGGKGRYEVLIIFENNGDTPLQDVILNDIIPNNFEIKDWSVKGADGKRDDVSMESTTQGDSTSISWTIPAVAKSERLEVSFEIKGDGEVDAEQLNKFHGATFGDEIQDDETVIDHSESEEEEVSEESESEVVEESSEADEGGVDVSDFKWRDDVLLKVLDAHEIDAALKDEFIQFAIAFDHDNNNYLKKQELEDAAKAWNEREQSSDDEDESSQDHDEGDDSDSGEESEQVDDAEETGEESSEEQGTDETESGEAESDSEEQDAVSEEASESVAETKSCPICTEENPMDALTCHACGFAF